MRCASCSSDQGKSSFTNSQLKKPAGERRCVVCAAAAAAAVPGGSVGGDGGGGGTSPAGASGDPPAAVSEPTCHGASLASASDDRGTNPTNAWTEPLGGARVALVGPGAAHLNGIFATVAEIDAPPPTAQTCAWAACGTALSGEAAAKNRCGRCKRVYYCSRRCQKSDWKAGGHKLVCNEAPCCTICLDGGDEPLPVQRGCACRGDAGLAHVACQARAAAHKGAGGCNSAWERCPTCGQNYTGSMQLGLAHELMRRLEKSAPEDGHLLAARHNLGQALKDAGDLAAAGVLLRDVLAVRRRVFGRSHPSTRAAATTLADVLDLQGRHAEAVVLYRESLAATPADEQEDGNTLADKANLAGALSKTGEHAEAEALLRGVLATEERLHGPGDARTLQAAELLGAALRDQGRHAEAEAVYRPTLAAQRRVLGPEHPRTLTTAHNLAGCLANQDQHAEAERLLQDMLTVH